jgi:hypothetical protein
LAQEAELVDIPLQTALDPVAVVWESTAKVQTEIQPVMVFGII